MVYRSLMVAAFLAVALAQLVNCDEQISFSSGSLQGENELHHANRLLQDYPIIDTHNDLPL